MIFVLFAHRSLLNEHTPNARARSSMGGNQNAQRCALAIGTQVSQLATRGSNLACRQVRRRRKDPARDL